MSYRQKYDIYFYFLFFRMGSFTSMPKIRPAPNADDTDVDYGNVGERVGLDVFLAKCKNQLGSLPPLIPRNVRHRKNSLGNEGNLSFLYSLPKCLGNLVFL
jgi:hypothetical protein